MTDCIVVGAGFSGAIMAERLAAAGHRVEVWEARPHLGGNAFDCLDAHGVLIHPYGPHLFHTNSDLVLTYLSRFTGWRPYQHRVRSRIRWRGEVVEIPMPINRTTVNRLYGLDLDPDGVRRHLAALAEPRSPIRTSEDAVVAQVGRELYEACFRGYTRKQWGRDPSQLDASVAARVPARHDDDDRYFTDRHQCLPVDGYAALFARLLDHPRIRVALGRRFDPQADRHRAPLIVWTGPLDAWFGHRLGRLPYRSLRFEHEHRPRSSLVQSVAVINEGDEAVPWTRTTEFRHITGQAHSGTSLIREYPQAEGEPYYPVPEPAARALADRYRALAATEPGVVFVGRLAQYRYLNMDQAVAAALTQAAKLTGGDR